ncbi:DUF998 domain-containing protein [Tropicimonas sp. S265A]|uniref:DUF998 domain-containing protein n=1 Tax=Tropicimonas sp. S265A TaxID=3415134 RepID=UPI003C7EC688
MAYDGAPRREATLVERPELLVVCGIAGLVGSIAPTIMNVIASTVAQHDFIADTISDLGRGPHKWIMDTGFYISAAGLLGLSIGAAHAHLGRAGWSLGIFVLALTALFTVLLGVWDKFGNGDDLSVHTRLTFALGPLYLLGPIVMAKGIATVSKRMVPVFYASAVLWLVFATAFKLAPTAYDGILEKIAVLATMLWTVPLSWILIERGLQRVDALSRELWSGDR